jgi:hypothetical protein
MIKYRFHSEDLITKSMFYRDNHGCYIECDVQGNWWRCWVDSIERRNAIKKPKKEEVDYYNG